MDYVQPINPRHHDLEPLLAAQGRTVDWFNSGDCDPYTEANIARHSFLEAAKVVPFHYRSTIATLPELRTWIATLVAEARKVQAAHGRSFATVAHGPSLMLLGVTGVGKTHQAYGAIRSLAVTGVASRWVVTTAADMYGALRPRHNIDSETEFRKYRDARLLLVDDLGAERKATEFTEEINFRLVNHRYERHLPTLFTSNVLPKELAARLGDRVTSRLAEMCQRITIKGDDRRRGEAA
ncbi:ATP-binding protein [Streptomyces asiaticus]|uniref:ATP-binding protein n=1 Tax=Streptomyces asiaticus TaxID=114695 RepID=UPI001BAB8001|nr:ATP-binding protein [Streptomyces asiaticus]